MELTSSQLFMYKIMFLTKIKHFKMPRMAIGRPIPYQSPYLQEANNTLVTPLVSRVFIVLSTYVP